MGSSNSEKREPDSVEYWTKQDEKIIISKVKIIAFLESEGLMKHKIDLVKYQLVQIRNKIISPVGDHILTEMVRDDLTTRKQFDVFEKYLNGQSKKSVLLESLKSFDGCFHSDSQDKVYFYFANEVVEVTKDNIDCMPYEALECAVWHNSIINKSFTPLASEDSSPSDFEQFIFNVCGQDKSRKESLESILGYLLSDYKNPTKAKAIIFLDEKISDDGEANGGTGKSLVGNAISKLRNTLQISGKNLNTQGRFLFQQVGEATKVLFYDDVKADFNFEDLYSVITGDMTTEKKYSTAMTIPFSKSPKILISSNFIVKGTGGESDQRRLIEFEFSDYYNIKRTPLSEFNKRFFDDWDEEEWSKFYLYMIKCTQSFLAKGIIQPESINLDRNKFMSNTSQDFILFSEGFNVNTKYNKGELYEKFLTDFPGNRGRITKHAFKKWLDHYGNYAKLEVDHSKSNGSAFVEFME
jgi:hypothetical protein